LQENVEQLNIIVVAQGISTMSQVDCVHAGANVLGESPVWSVQEQALYWVDSRGPTIFRLDGSSGKVRSWKLPEVIGSIVVRKAGGLVAATKSGFHFFSTETGAVQQIADPEKHLPDNRFNDGRCDRRGRYWSGTMSDARRDPAGTLYCLSPDLTVRGFKSGIIVPNSLCWSPDDRTMYFADTYKATIWAYDFDLERGEMSHERVFVDTSAGPGRPDGATVDADGCLWSAEYGGSRVVRYTPQGKIDRTIALPATSVTSCSFGGAHLDMLYITTATQRLTAEQLKEQPLAGGLFAVRPGVSGVPEPAFAG
jgi:sugar lactone lactonase YvrE